MYCSTKDQNIASSKILSLDGMRRKALSLLGHSYHNIMTVKLVLYGLSAILVLVNYWIRIVNYMFAVLLLIDKHFLLMALVMAT